MSKTPGNRLMDFYSARLLFISLVEGKKAVKSNLYDDLIVVFRAQDFTHAFQRALEIGKLKETIYLNSDGQKVRWAFIEIVNLDYIGKTIDGNEVGSRLHYRLAKNSINLQKRFHPERSKPTESI